MTNRSPSSKLRLCPEDQHKDGGPKSGYWWARRHEPRPEQDPWWPEIVEVLRAYKSEYVPVYRDWEGAAYVLECGSKRKWSLKHFDFLERLEMPEHLREEHRALEAVARATNEAKRILDELPKAVSV